MNRLNRVRTGYDEYQRFRLRVEELETLATKMTSVISETPKGGGSCKDDVWATLMDYKMQCGDKLAAYLEDCRQLEEELKCIRNPRIRTAMQYRYIDGKKISDIAEAMFCDERSVYIWLKKGRSIYCEQYHG